MLTQAEIDALLAGSIEIEGSDTQDGVNLAELMGQPAEAAAKGKPDTRKIRPYNFWSPDYFSKDQIRAVELVHEDLSERLTSSLPTFLRTNLRPRVVHTEQGRFHDFVNDLPPASLSHMITLAPLPGQMVLTISPEVSYVILEQRLGGQNDNSRKSRNLTEIDQFLLRGTVEHMLNDIKASWSKVVAIEPGLEDSTTNQHWVQMMMGNERVLLIAFDLTIQNTTGTMNVYIPFTMLKPIASVLNPHSLITGRKERQIDPVARQMASESISHVTIPVRVFLGTGNITFHDLSHLKLGDVIPLSTATNDELPVYVADQACFKARIGKVGSRMAALITTTIKPVAASLESRAGRL
jgi:flagellar motor switch protein FliM